jgi:hypothetical protein
MSLSSVRIGWVMAIALAITVAFASAAPAEPKTVPPQNSAAINPDEGIRADDVKDVFEAIKFIMVNLVVVTASVRNIKRAEVYEASKLVRLPAMIG